MTRSAGCHILDHICLLFCEGSSGFSLGLDDDFDG